MVKESIAPAYDQWYVNEGDGQTVLLLHGLFGDLEMWASTVEALKSNYRVIIPRLPLFDLPTNNARLQDVAELLHDFISWHKLDDVIIAGHGAGGQLALLYTYKYPANVNRLVISGSTGFTFESYLNRIDHPVLLLWGLEDKITPPEVAMHFHDFLQNSMIHFIEQCGHVPMIEQPEPYNWHVAHFLDA